jgi:hypothetical protein
MLLPIENAATVDPKVSNFRLRATRPASVGQSFFRPSDEAIGLMKDPAVDNSNEHSAGGMDWFKHVGHPSFSWDDALPPG